jgi:hypothetical protein
MKGIIDAHEHYLHKWEQEEEGLRN